jgi:hypothetical protein
LNDAFLKMRQQQEKARTEGQRLTAEKAYTAEGSSSGATAFNEQYRKLKESRDAHARSPNAWSAKYQNIIKQKQSEMDVLRQRYEASQQADQSTVSGRLQKELGGGMDAQSRDIIRGAQFGESVLGEEGLGRLGRDETMEAMEAQAAELAKGFSSEEMLARKEKGIEGIQGSVASQSRAAQAALARSGVKGQAAGAQLGNIAMSGIQARGNLERDLMIANREAQMQGLDVQRGLRQEAIAAEKFDLSQAAKEKKMVLASGLGMAGLGATERGAKLSADAAVAASKQSSGGGGGTTFVCSALKRTGRMNAFETKTMLSLMLFAVIKYTKFLAWYFREAPELANHIENTCTDMELNSIKKNTVTEVMKLMSEEGMHQGAQKYIKEIITLAEKYDYPIKDGLNKSSLLNTILYMPSLFTLKSTWRWIYNFGKLKLSLRYKRFVRKYRKVKA